MNTNPQHPSYQIHDLTNPNSIPEGIHLYGIKFYFNGDTKKIMFWFKNNIRKTQRVTIVFESKNESIRMEEGNLVLSLKGLNNYQDIRMALMIFKQIMRNNQLNNLNYHIIANSQNQANMVKNLAQELDLSIIINNENQSLDAENIQKVEAKLKKNEEYTASGSKTIEMSEGQRKITVTADGNAAYENISSLDIREQMATLLQEWQKDPLMSIRIRNLTTQELDQLLMENITSNLTRHRMESSSEQSAISNDNRNIGQVAIDKAADNDSKVNAQLGLVENHVSSSAEYLTVEQNKDGNINIITPQVTSSQINSSGVSSDSSSNHESPQYAQAYIRENTEQARDIQAEFYVDDEYNVYNSEEKFIGKIGPDYLIDYNTNSLYNRKGQKLGVISDINAMGKTIKQTNAKKLVREKLEKPTNKSAAFASLSIIIFILSGLLIITSLILYLLA